MLPKCKHPVTGAVAPQKKLYIDGGVARNLLVAKDLVLNKNRDFFFVYTGREGCVTPETELLMADGSWKKVEDVKVNDLVVSPQKDGSIFFSPIVDIQTFDSHKNYSVRELRHDHRELYECSWDHQFPIRDKPAGEWKNISAEEYSKKSKRFKQNSAALLCPEIPFFLGKKNCEIEPYTLGFFLGNGSFSSRRSQSEYYSGKEAVYKGFYKTVDGKQIWVKPHITKAHASKYQGLFLHRSLTISTPYQEPMDYIKQFYPFMATYKKKDINCYDYKFSLLGEFALQLSKIGLEGKDAGTKFIPQEALLSDAVYRKKLLAGLIDSDGYLTKTNAYSITTKSEQLAKGISNLVYSLGGRVTIRKIKKGIKKLNFVGEYYCVSFYLGNKELPVLVSHRKRMKAAKTYMTQANQIAIDVVPVDGTKVYGLSVLSPSNWYVCNDWNVTKNCGKSTLAMQHARFLNPATTLDNVTMDPEKFPEMISAATKGEVCILDEAFTGLASIKAQSKINYVLKSIFMEVRQKNLFIFIVLPSMFYLDKYVLLERANVLFHSYFKNNQRGFYAVYPPFKIKSLELYGRKSRNMNVTSPWYRGGFYDNFIFDAPGETTQFERYKKMKMASFTKKAEALKEEADIKTKDPRADEFGLSLITNSTLNANEKMYVKVLRLRDLNKTGEEITDLLGYKSYTVAKMIVTLTGKGGNKYREMLDTLTKELGLKSGKEKFKKSKADFKDIGEGNLPDKEEPEEEGEDNESDGE